MGKIAKEIYGGNLFVTYYNKYVNLERIGDMFDHVSMNQVFKVI